jgi:hypothetical protein
MQVKPFPPVSGMKIDAMPVGIRSTAFWTMRHCAQADAKRLRMNIILIASFFTPAGPAGGLT